MTITEIILPIIALIILCAGWVVVQILAKKMGTKNHFEIQSGDCGHCNCSECKYH